MGAWGDGVFENDDACDFLSEVESAEPEKRSALIFQVLRGVVDHCGYLEVDQGNIAIAAAALVAAARSGELAGAAGERSASIKVSTATPDLFALAARALERVTGTDSEWSGLWGEGAVLEKTRTLAMALQAAADESTLA